MSTQTYINGKIFTGKNETDFVSAMKVTDGIIEWTGDSAAIDAKDAIDLKGQVVVPGFVDAHIHPMLVGEIMDQATITIPDVTNIEEAIQALKKFADETPEDAWIEGWCWDESKLAEHRALTRHDLDKVSTSRPVHVMRSDYHSSAVNTRALELAGVTKDTKDVLGGIIEKDEHGEPTGFMIENANTFIEKVKPSKKVEQQIRNLVRVGHRFAKLGITCATEMMALLAPLNYLDVYRRAEADGLKQRITIYVLWEEIKNNNIEAFDQSDLEGRIRISGVKLFMDGTIFLGKLLG